MEKSPLDKSRQIHSFFPQFVLSTVRRIKVLLMEYCNCRKLATYHTESESVNWSVLNVCINPQNSMFFLLLFGPYLHIITVVHIHIYIWVTCLLRSRSHFVFVYLLRLCCCLCHCHGFVEWKVIGRPTDRTNDSKREKMSFFHYSVAFFLSLPLSLAFSVYVHVFIANKNRTCAIERMQQQK